MEDDSEKPGGKYGYKRQRGCLRVGSMVTLLCLTVYILYIRHMAVLTEDAAAHVDAPSVPQKIRRVLNSATANLPDFRQK